MTRGCEEKQSCSGLPVNEVKVLDDSDFQNVKNLCVDNNKWECVYEKRGLKVWKRPVENSSFDMLKATAALPDVRANTVYDVLQDPMYRSIWDKYMIDSAEIGFFAPNSDLSYYSVGSMPPVKSRDFVMQRTWLDLGKEKFICSHSVCHNKYPPVKSHVRAIAYITAYMIREMGEGCELTYITHSDPKGKIPAWLMNRLTKVVGPKVMKSLHKACQNYPKWKAQNRPDWKPWVNPEQQLDQPRIKISECRPMDYETDQESVSVSGPEDNEDSGESDDE